ncbi:MAG: hypothetical protein AB1403_13450 [Candidatus Riflebacteria bacterium]
MADLATNYQLVQLQSEISRVEASIRMVATEAATQALLPNAKQVNRLTHICQALWDIIKNEMKISDEDLAKLVAKYEAQAQQEKEARPIVVKCRKCGAAVTLELKKCQSCGEDYQGELGNKPKIFTLI